jgi:hypothetical protein
VLRIAGQPFSYFIDLAHKKSLSDESLPLRQKIAIQSPSLVVR